MLMQIKTNGATDLIINLTTDNVEYVQDMLKMVENNIVAVKSDYYGATQVELESTLTVGKHIKFKGSDGSYGEVKPDLIISAGESDDVLKNYEALPMETLLSVKEQLKKLQDTNASLKKENEYIKATVERLEAALKEEVN